MNIDDATQAIAQTLINAPSLTEHFGGDGAGSTDIRVYRGLAADPPGGTYMVFWPIAATDESTLVRRMEMIVVQFDVYAQAPNMNAVTEAADAVTDLLIRRRTLLGSPPAGLTLIGVWHERAVNIEQDEEFFRASFDLRFLFDTGAL